MLWTISLIKYWREILYSWDKSCEKIVIVLDYWLWRKIPPKQWRIWIFAFAKNRCSMIWGFISGILWASDTLSMAQSCFGLAKIIKRLRWPSCKSFPCEEMKERLFRCVACFRRLKIPRCSGLESLGFMEFFSVNRHFFRGLVKLRPELRCCPDLITGIQKRLPFFEDFRRQLSWSSHEYIVWDVTL